VPSVQLELQFIQYKHSDLFIKQNLLYVAANIWPSSGWPQEHKTLLGRDVPKTISNISHEVSPITYKNIHENVLGV
jgi:hypothetical protein